MLQVQPAAGAVRPAVSVESEQAVHPLHGAAGRALVEVVDRAHHRDGRVPLAALKMRVVAGDDVLDARRVVVHAHEGRVRVELAQRADAARGV